MDHDRFAPTWTEALYGGAAMTPEERLAAALGKHHMGTYPESSLLNAARNILAADPILAADLALAAAVRRLEAQRQGLTNRWDIYHNGDDVFVSFFDAAGRTVASGVGPTISDAIEKALP